MTDPIRWFRMYAEAVDDEKLRLLAFEDRWHFIAILCCKAQGLLDPGDPLMRRKVAIKLGLADRELDEVTRRLADVGLIDLQTFAPLAWERRQFKGDQDSTAAERQRRYRESQKSVTGESRVTEPLRHGPVTRPETETDTEKTKARKRALTRPESVSEAVWQDFLAIRRAKRAPLTDTAIEGIASEAAKAGMTLGEALAMCCQRGWQGFNAGWVDGKAKAPAEPWAGAI